MTIKHYSRDCRGCKECSKGERRINDTESTTEYAPATARMSKQKGALNVEAPRQQSWLIRQSPRRGRSHTYGPPPRGRAFRGLMQVSLDLKISCPWAGVECRASLLEEFQREQSELVQMQKTKTESGLYGQVNR